MSGIPEYLPVEEIDRLMEKHGWHICTACGRDQRDMNDLEKLAHDIHFWSLGCEPQYEGHNPAWIERRRIDAAKQLFDEEWPAECGKLSTALGLFEKAVRKFNKEKDLPAPGGLALDL